MPAQHGHVNRMAWCQCHSHAAQGLKVFLHSRLTPTYALAMATVNTWMRHLGSGPLWKQVVTSETTACRKYYWAHLLYINNYIYDDNLCFPQSWYVLSI